MAAIPVMGTRYLELSGESSKDEREIEIRITKCCRMCHVTCIIAARSFGGSGLFFIITWSPTSEETASSLLPLELRTSDESLFCKAAAAAEAARAFFMFSFISFLSKRKTQECFK